MPDATIRNNTQDIINVGFWVGAPWSFQNEVGAGQTARVHLPSLPLTVEVRIDNGSNRFSTGESWKKGGELVTACAAGTAAVVAGSMWLLGMFGPRASPAGTTAVAGAGLAWRAANDGAPISAHCTLCAAHAEHS